MASKWTSLSPAEIQIIRHYLGDTVYSDFTLADVQKLDRKLARLQKTIKTASAKGKGRELQKWAAQKISELLGIPFDQQDDESLIRYREMGQPGTDVVLRAEAAQRFPYSVECKSVESLNLRDTVEQARANTRPGTDWLVVHRSKRLPVVLAILDWDAFEALIRLRKES